MSEPPIHIDGPVSGDVFTGGKREIYTGGGDYIEKATLAPPAGVAALRQLPSPPADFTGRAAELAELRQAVRARGAGLCGLRGLGGVGKTALALELARDLSADYPDAQIFLNLQGVKDPLTPEDVMAHVIRAYMPVEKLPDDPAQLAAAYRSVLNGQRALLLLDNASGAEQVKPLIPPPGCLLLVTSRTHFSLPGMRALNLDSLPPADAQALLLKRAPRIADHAAELAEVCAYLPLALTLAGGALAEREDLEPGDYIRRLRQARLTVLDEVTASLTLSSDLLSAELQRLWRALAVFPAGFDASAAATVWSLEADPASDRLGDLLRYSLLEYSADAKRYRLHDLARDFLSLRLSEPERDEAQRHHSAHYKNVLAVTDRIYLKGGEDITRGLALFDLERANIVAGQAWAAAHAEQDAAAARLASDYSDVGVYVLNLRQHPRERIAWLASALAAARRLKDGSAEGGHLGNLAIAHIDLGEARQAIEYYEQALLILREFGDRRGEGTVLDSLGTAYAILGETRRAIDYYAQAIAIAREIGDRREEVHALGNLGNAYADLGEQQQAIDYYEQVMAIARDIGDRVAQGNAAGNLGVAFYNQGEARRAAEYYEQQLNITREIGDRDGETIASWNLGLLHEQQGELERAIALMQLRVDHLRELRHTDADAVAALVEELRQRLAGG